MNLQDRIIDVAGDDRLPSTFTFDHPTVRTMWVTIDAHAAKCAAALCVTMLRRSPSAQLVLNCGE